MRRFLVVAIACALAIGACLLALPARAELKAGAAGAAIGPASTLAAKAQYCQTHVFSRHLQDGLIIGNETDPTGNVRHTSGNAGQHTACLLSALSFQWALTGDSATRATAQEVAAALLKLEQITEVPGLTSRQYKMMQGPGPDEVESDWHQAGPYRWLGDVSTDEMTWYLTGLADYLMLCAEGEQRSQASATIRRVVGRLLDHDMRLTNADGSVTRYGDCSRETPLEPLSCLHGLHYLKVGELCSFQERFADAYEEYIADQRYFENAVFCYKRNLVVGQWASYDWQLAAPSFEFLIKFDKDPRRRAALTQGLMEMAAAPDAQPYAHLVTALLGLGGAEKVRQWLAEFDPNGAEFDPNGRDGDELVWYLWVYWKARAGGIVTEKD
jgi:hypothetical protein